MLSTSLFQEILVKFVDDYYCIFRQTCFNLLADGKNQEAWAAKLKSEDYELLCPNGGRAPVDQFEKCHLLKAPPHMVSYQIKIQR